VVAQTQAGLTRMLLDELFAVRTASVEALIGARHQADTLYESSLWGALPLCLIACAAEGRHRHVLCTTFCCGTISHRMHSQQYCSW